MDSRELGMFVVACICATVGLMVSMSFLVFHIYHRHNKIVKMTSPYLNMITSIGAALLNIVCFLYGLDVLFKENQRTLSVLCQVRTWIIVCSCTFLLGPVCTKAWRVHNIFKYGFARKVVIRDGKLVSMIMVLLAVDMTLMTLWQTIDPVTSTRKIFTEVDFEPATVNGTTIMETQTLTECWCGKMPVWIAVFTIWKTTQITLCLIFAWKTRLVSVPCLNDSSNTLSAIFVAMVIAICATMATPSIRYNQTARFIILNIAIALCAIVFQMLLFLPKVRYWWRTPDDVSPRVSTSSFKELASAELPPFPSGVVPEMSSNPDADKPDMTSYTTGDMNGNIFTDDGLLEIVEENKTLKESLREKEDLISNLQGHLDRAKESLLKLPAQFEIPLRHDSGLDADVSTDVHDDIYDVLRSPDNKKDRSEVYRVEITPRSDVTNDTHEIPIRPKAIYSDSRTYSSNDSVASYIAEFSDIRNSIAAELEGAAIVNSDLRNSLSVDMERPYSETEWLYESNAAPELAGSIAHSYNLGDNREMFSYLQAYLPRENSVFQVTRTRRLSGSSIRSMPSSENMSSRSADVDNVSCDVPSLSRDSATPNSQQHAAILRYYSYRHMSDGLKRFNTYRINRDYKFRRNVSNNASQKSNSSKYSQPDGTIAVCNAPHAPPRPPKLFKSSHLAKDSFV